MADKLAIAGFSIFLGMMMGSFIVGAPQFLKGYTEGYQARINYEHGQ